MQTAQQMGARAGNGKRLTENIVIAPDRKHGPFDATALISSPVARARVKWGDSQLVRLQSACATPPLYSSPAKSRSLSSLLSRPLCRRGKADP